MPITPRFSVVIPTRGDAPHLRRALASALAQGVDVEVLVAHAEGAPLPPELLADERVIGVPCAPTTPGARRNAALSAAVAPLVAFLDDDDLWTGGHLAAAGAQFEREPGLALLASDAWLFDDTTEDGSGEPPVAFESLARFLGPGRTFEPTSRELLVRNTVLTPTVVARRKVLRDAGGFDAHLAAMEDWDFWVRLARRARVRVVREPTVLVRRRRGSVSRDVAAMSSCAIEVVHRALDAGIALTRRERSALEGRLWHDRAYACLVHDDATEARRAAARAIAFLPGRAKNYMYWLAGWAPSWLRRRVFGAERRPESRP